MGNKYLIFLGCAIPYRVSAYEISARKVLAKLGVELVEMPEFNFCAPSLTVFQLMRFPLAKSS